VAPTAHHETFTELPEELWLVMTGLAHCMARALEKTLIPRRCYVASLGSAEPGLPMTCAHIHVHVVPVHATDERPPTVLTWSNGVLVTNREERRRLAAELRRHLS